MDPARWQRVQEVFQQALGQPTTAVDSFIADACADDEWLRAEVTRLLEARSRAGHAPERRRLTPPDTDITVTHEAAGPGQEVVFAGTSRFEMRRQLGSGGFGDVFEVYDRDRRSLAALKYLRHFRPDQLYRLKKEFRTLSDIRHQNLIQVYELFSSHTPPFFTMELLTGRDLGDYLREVGLEAADARARLRPRILEYLWQLGEAMIALHDADLVHRDVKPSNVFITADERVVLLDLGLVKHLTGPDVTTTVELAGTPHYLAPEQLQNARLTAASDWYAVGVLLYLVLTGKMPFEGEVAAILADKVARMPPRPSAIVEGVPAELDLLCHRLLQRNPDHRPSGREVVSTFREATRRGSPPITGPSPVSRVFVSRERELHALGAAFADSERGATVCVHVRGPSGVGKTTLIRRFLAGIRAKKPGCAVLSGRCYETEAAPHKGLDELLDHLGRFLKRLDPNQVASLLPRYFVLLTRLFPVLQDLRTATRPVPDIPDLQEQRHRAFGALRECFARISETYPLILWIDDLQWSDVDTARFLNDVVHAADPFSCLLVLSYRDSDVATNPVLRILEPTPAPSRRGAAVRVLNMQNLDFEEARDLASRLVPPAPAGAESMRTAEIIARESKGNPYFIAELARYTAALPDPRSVTAGAFGIGHVIKRRVAALPEPALRLLELIAVAGQPLPTDACTRAIGPEPGSAQVRNTLIREHLIRTHVSDTGERLDLYHDQIRHAIMEYLSPEAATVYHRLLATALEAIGSSENEQLAVHFEAAGSNDKAMEYTRRAADEAVNALAFDRAARMYRRLLASTPQTPAERQRLLERLGAALSNAGRGKEAAAVFLEASAGLQKMQGTELRRRACEQYLRSGHLDEGMKLCRQLMQEVGVSFPERPWALVASLLWHRLQLRRHVSSVRLRPDNALTDFQKLRLDVCWTATLGMSMVDVLRSAEFQARYTLLALKAGDRTRVALGLAGELVMGATSGTRPRRETERLFNEALALATATHNPHARGFVMFSRGVASWIEGDWAGCYASNQSAAATYREECSGVVWELTTANTFALSSLVMLGRWREHATRLPDLIQEAEGRGDRYGAVTLPLLAYAFIDYLANDQPARAHVVIRDALSLWPEGFHLQHCDALVGETETFLYERDPTAAKALLDRQWRRLQQSHLLKIQLNRVLLTALRARTHIALALVGSTGERKDALNAARDDARRLSRINATWADGPRHLIRAGIATMEGDRAAATASLQSAGAVFGALHMEHYLAVTKLRMSQLDPQLQQEANDASQWMHDQGIAAPSRIADMLAPGEWGA